MSEVKACLLCGAPIVYLDREVELECSFCKQKFMSNAHCANEHYVCDDCHSKPGRQVIMTECLQTTSKNPIEIIQKLMSHPSINMHGPEHHTLFGSALLAAYRNAGGEIDLAAELLQMEQRSQRVPGGTCGLWGTCGAAVSCGIFYSLISKATPLAGPERSDAISLTAECLKKIGQSRSARCCKREGFTAISTTVEYVARTLGVQMELPSVIKCSFFPHNGECPLADCPFYPQKK